MGIFAAISDLLFPPKCVFCRQVLRGGDSAVCDSCQAALTGNETVMTGKYFSRCAVALNYAGSVRAAIDRFKFEDKPGYATEFGKILARSIRQELAGQYDLITWIPVSEERQKKRGYDQSMLLAMAAALELEDVAVETLRKTAHNAAQSSLADEDARRSNVQGAYMVPEPELVEGKRILLIDDTITTGATLDEASRTLLEAGANEVLGAVLARPADE